MNKKIKFDNDAGTELARKCLLESVQKFYPNHDVEQVKTKFELVVLGIGRKSDEDFSVMVDIEFTGNVPNGNVGISYPPWNDYLEIEVDSFDELVKYIHDKKLM